MIIGVGMPDLETGHQAGSSAAQPLVSIILLNWNTTGLTLDCVRSIREKTAYVPYEIVIVDNGSRAEEKDALKPVESDAVRVFYQPVNLGFSGGCNFGASQARGEYFLFLNNDTLVENEGWISALLDTFRADPAIGGVSCNVRERSGYAFPRTAVDIPHLCGAAMIVPRAAWTLVGEFDTPNFFPIYGEELDWSYRARQIGFKLRFCLESRVFHFESQTEAKNVSKQKSFEVRIMHRIKFRFFNFRLSDWLRGEVWSEFVHALRHGYLGLLIRAYVGPALKPAVIVRERRKRAAHAKWAVERMSRGGFRLHSLSSGRPA